MASGCPNDIISARARLDIREICNLTRQYELEREDSYLSVTTPYKYDSIIENYWVEVLMLAREVLSEDKEEECLCG